MPVEPWERQPFKQPAPVPTCPQYAESGCCTMDQNLLLMVNFLSIQSAFANIDNGGCPACAYNAEAFWCAYTCSPDQDKFLSIVGVEMVPDPTRGGEITEVLHTRVQIQPNFTCAVYGACDKVKTVTETSAMSNAEGFFAYQGQYEAIQHGAYIDFDYVDSEDAITAAPYSCCNWPLDRANPQLGNSSCPCAYCGGMCSGGECAGSGGGDGGIELGELDTPWYFGFQGASTGGVWGAAGVLIITISWWRWRFSGSGKDDDDTSSQSSRGSSRGPSPYVALPSK